MKDLLSISQLAKLRGMTTETLRHYDRIGLFADVSVALADMRVSILSINTVKRGDDKVLLNLKISCKNIEHYNSIVSRLKSLKDVVDVTRGYA